MNLSKFCIERPITTLMVILSLIVLGIISIYRLPLMFFPEMSWPSIRISVPYSSSSPEEVEELITIPIEDAMGTLGKLKKMNSSSSRSNSSVSLEFQFGTDMDLMALEVRDRLDQVRAELPEDVERMRIHRWQTTDRPIMRFSVAFEGPKQKLYSIVEDMIEPRLSRIDGVANVEVRGLDKKELLVELDQGLLQAHNVDISVLNGLLSRNNINLSLGEVIDGGRKFSIRAIGEFQSIKEISQMPIPGKNIVLSDLAKVSYDYPIKRSFQKLNGHNAISIQVYKASTANMVRVSVKVRSALDKIRSEVGEDWLNIHIYRDESKGITDRLNTLRDSGLLGGVLVVAVILLFLCSVKSTLIICLSIPISVLCAFMFMYMARVFFNSTITINLVSTMALMLAVGMLVDPAVVVLESIFRKRQDEKLDAGGAALLGSREVGTAVMAATATTICVFVPLIFLGDNRLMIWMKDFGITICAALVSSLFVALTLIPLASSRMFKGAEKERSRFLVRLTAKYTSIIGWTLKFRKTTIAVALVITGMFLYLLSQMDRLPNPWIPPRQVDITVELPRHYTEEDALGLFTKLEEMILKKKDELELENLSANFRARSGRMTLHLAEEGQRSTMHVKNEVKSMLPVIPGVKFKMERMRGRGGNIGVSVDIKGKSTSVLKVLAENVKDRLSDIEGIEDIDTSLERGEEEIQVRVHREKASRYGLSPMQVARTISEALGTRAGTTYKTEDGEIDITVQLKEEDRANLEQLKNTMFENSRGEMVSFGSLAAFKHKKGPTAIRREDRKTIVNVFANTPERMGMYAAGRKIEERLKSEAFPSGYTWQMGENYRRTLEMDVGSNFALLLSAALIYIIMASLFESYSHPFTIMFSIPFSLIGVCGVLLLMQRPLDPMGIMGLLILFGLVVNNGIVLIDHINHLRREGMPKRDAIIRGGQNRLRPILMTSVTTILGLLPMVTPLILGTAEGGDAFWAPVGLVIIAGLTTSTFLTLVIAPTIYSLIDDFSAYIRRAVSLV